MNHAAEIDNDRAHQPLIRRNNLDVIRCRIYRRKPVAVTGDMCHVCLLAEPEKLDDARVLLTVVAAAGVLMAFGWALQKLFGAQ